MTGQINVNKIAARTGNTITINSGDKISGAAGSIVQPGMIIQVVSAQYTTEVGSTSSTYTDTGLTATITPKYATSKILVQINMNGAYKTNDNTGTRINTKVFRDSTELDIMTSALGYTNTALRQSVGTASYVLLDNPSTTNAITYKTQFSNPSSSATAYWQLNNVPSDITLLEIAQ